MVNSVASPLQNFRKTETGVKDGIKRFIKISGILGTSTEAIHRLSCVVWRTVVFINYIKPTIPLSQVLKPFESVTVILNGLKIFLRKKSRNTLEKIESAFQCMQQGVDFVRGLAFLKLLNIAKIRLLSGNMHLIPTFFASPLGIISEVFQLTADLIGIGNSVILIIDLKSRNFTVETGYKKLIKEEQLRLIIKVMRVATFAFALSLMLLGLGGGFFTPLILIVSIVTYSFHLVEYTYSKKNL